MYEIMWKRLGGGPLRRETQGCRTGRKLHFNYVPFVYPVTFCQVYFFVLFSMESAEGEKKGIGTRHV